MVVPLVWGLRLARLGRCLSIIKTGPQILNGFLIIADLIHRKDPRLMSLFPLPLPPPESGLKNFFEKGGRFGPHNQHHSNHQSCLEDRDGIAYLTYFNAGLRVYDIRDARVPKTSPSCVPSSAPRPRLLALVKK